MRRSSPQSSSSSRGITSAAGPTQLTAAALLELCEQLYDSFNASQHTLDTHLHNSLQQHKLTDDEVCFVQEVVYGVLRYSRFLNAFLASFWDKNSGTALRCDTTKYRVVTYLAAFRLQELTFDTFRQLVECQDVSKMEVLLSYLFDPETLTGPCREDWLKVYDKEFVDSTIQGLLSWGAEAADLLQSLRDRAYFTQRNKDATCSTADASSSSSCSPSPTRSSRQQQHSSSRTIVPQPFNLSQPRPKAPPQPEPVPPAPQAQPPPKVRQGPTKEQRAIQAAREATRAAIAARQADPRFGPFKLRVLERPSKAPLLQAQAEAALAAELAKRPPKARPPPPPPVSEVRLTSAAVLREEQLYRRKQAEEAAALQRYEAELRDSAAFDRWQESARLQDALAQQQRVERLRQEMSTAAGAAAAAKAALQEAKAAAGCARKQERAELEAARGAQAAQVQAANSVRKQEVVAGREGARKAQESVLAEKRAAADAVRQQCEAEARQKAEAAAAEMCERKDLIAQLRGMEAAGRRAASRGRVHSFDPTAASGSAINEQMSLLELRERLAAAQQREREEEEMRREKIRAQKAAREASLAAKVEQLSTIRRLASAQASARKAAATMQRAQTAAAVLQRHEAAALKLSDRLDAKHEAAAAEAARLAAEQKRIRFEQMQIAAGAAAVEAGRFRGVRDGAQRSCEQRQAQKLQDSACEAANAARLSATRRRALDMQQRQHNTKQRAYDSDLQAATEQMGKASARLLSQRQSKAAAQRQHEQQQRQQCRQQQYRPSQGSPLSSIQARIQALAMAADDCRDASG